MVDTTFSPGNGVVPGDDNEDGRDPKSEESKGSNNKKGKGTGNDDGKNADSGTTVAIVVAGVVLVSVVLIVAVVVAAKKREAQRAQTGGMSKSFENPVYGEVGTTASTWVPPQGAQATSGYADLPVSAHGSALGNETYDNATIATIATASQGYMDVSPNQPAPFQAEGTYGDVAVAVEGTGTGNNGVDHGGYTDIAPYGEDSGEDV